MGKRKPIEHGTRAGYKAHRRVQEPACTACKAANAAWQQIYRKRRSTPWKLLEAPSGTDPLLPPGCVPWGPVTLVEATAANDGWLVPPGAVVRDGLWSPLPLLVRVPRDTQPPVGFVEIEALKPSTSLGIPLRKAWTGKKLRLC